MCINHMGTIHAYEASPINKKFWKNKVILFTLYIYRGYLHITDLFSFDIIDKWYIFL